MSKRVLITGAAGFIGGLLCREILVSTDWRIVGFDNLNDYYDVSLKVDRLNMVRVSDGAGRFSFVQGDLSNDDLIGQLFRENAFDAVIHLAAQAGVRYSIENPRAYIDSNIVGFFNILEACRTYQVGQLVYASSSSVYGNSAQPPFSIEERADAPESLYAATKRADELMAYAYSKLYGISCTGLRFFTVYGPYGRPDMAYFKFALKLLEGSPIQIYNYGDLERDFTYIDDVVAGVMAVAEKPPAFKEGEVPFRLYNVGNSSPVKLLDFVEVLERAMKRKGLIAGEPVHELVPMQKGDALRTCADTAAFERDYGFSPSTPIEIGMSRFVDWFADYRTRR